MTSFETIQQQKIQLEANLNQESFMIKNQLSKIDNLEAKLKQMQSQLLSLSKVEKSCDKKNKDELHCTFIAIRNKVSLTQNHNKTMQRQNKQNQHLSMQKSKIQEMRQKELSLLQTAKRQNQRTKQNMMRQIREISNRNQSVIRKMKQEQFQKNKLKAGTVKQQKESFKQSMIESKIKQMKQKHQLQMSRSQLRIQKKDELQRKYQQLLREKELIESRVREKKEYNKRLESLKKDICRMKDQDINKTIRDIKLKIRNYEKSQQEQNHRGVKQFQKDEEYIKYKLFEKFYEAEQKKREDIPNFVY